MSFTVDLSGSFFKQSRSFFPVYHIPESTNVVGSAVLIVQVIRVLPNVKRQDRSAFYFCNIHQGVVLICCAGYYQFVAVQYQPCPTATKACSSCGVELLFESIKATERSSNCIRQFACRQSAARWRKQLPKQAVVPMPTCAKEKVLNKSTNDINCFFIF